MQKSRPWILQRQKPWAAHKLCRARPLYDPLNRKATLTRVGDKRPPLPIRTSQPLRGSARSTWPTELPDVSLSSQPQLLLRHVLAQSRRPRWRWMRIISRWRARRICRSRANNPRLRRLRYVEREWNVRTSEFLASSAPPPWRRFVCQPGLGTYWVNVFPHEQS
jgi:hypothetical protein